MIFWAKLIKKHKLVSSCEYLITHEGIWDATDLYDALESACNTLDLARPIVLNKHVKEINRFSKTHFKRNDFIETIDFDLLEIELIDENKDDTPIFNLDYC